MGTSRTVSGADSIGYGEHVTLPHFYKWLGTGDTVIRRTANNKLFCPSQKHSSVTRMANSVEPKKWRGTTKTFVPALCTGHMPPSPSTFNFVPASLRKTDSFSTSHSHTKLTAPFPYEQVNKQVGVKNVGEIDGLLELCL